MLAAKLKARIDASKEEGGTAGRRVLGGVETDAFALFVSIHDCPSASKNVLRIADNNRCP